MKSTDIGNLSTLKCELAFMEAGYIVSRPTGDAHPYDLIVDDGRQLYRVQCKTGRLIGGVVHIWARGNNGRWYKTGGSRLYADKVELLAAYCPETDKVYVATQEYLNLNRLSFRIAPTENNQTKGVRWASEFEIRPLLRTEPQSGDRPQ